MTSKTKSPSQAVGPLALNIPGGLPLWDEAQIQQENWGGALGLPKKTAGAVLESRGAEERAMVAVDEGQRHAFKEAVMSFCGKTVSDVFLDWKRPVDVFAPFRPMLHRNMTPFLFPYDRDRGIFDSKAAEEAAKSAVMPTGKKGDTKSTATNALLHVQFPEVVQVLEPQALEAAVKEWEGVPQEEVTRRYRELQPLMQAYDPDLELGCPLTPVDACEMSYSTAVRHRLKDVEKISKLSAPPPFLMDAFNSALRFIEHAQSSVRNGEYLWELVYPHAPGTCHPVYNPNGKYIVKLFIEGAFRRVVIDDYLPVDVLGRPFLSFTSQKEIWPALLAKALFVALKSSCHLLFTDPETIVSCLRGGWVPQRIDPRIKPAVACALLLEYRKLLLKDDANTAEFLSNAENVTASLAKCEGNVLPPKIKNHAGEEEVVEDVVSASLVQQEGRSLSSASEDTATASRRLVLCASSSLLGERKKLFVIHKVAVFQNELAIQISTNPPVLFIQAKELTRESKNDVVQELVHYSSLNNMKLGGYGAFLESNSTLWVTFKELSAHLDLVVWHNFDQDSSFHFGSRLTGEEILSTQSHANKKAALSGSTNAVAVPNKRQATRWIHLNCEKPEEIAIISLGTFSCYSSSVATQKTALLPSTSMASRPLSAHSVARSVDSRMLRDDVRELFLELYTWERGDMLSYIGTFAYEPGKLQCMVQAVPAGSHIFRVTAVGLESPHVLAFLATQNFIMGDEKDVLSSANICKISDAGSYGAVERANEETLWFKRLITVKEPTMVSFVVSTLLPSDDPANHRDIPPTLLRDAKGAKTRVVNSKVVHKDNVVEETRSRFPDIPIMSYCRLMLIDLDKGTFCTGAVGRLVRKRLEPNQHGYLIIAYTLINSLSAVSLENTLDSVALEAILKQREITNNTGSDEKEDVSLRDKPGSLCGKGLWKLTISADHSLDSYKFIPHNVFSFVDEGQLKRGSNALLFAYMCTIFEKTYFTLLLDLDARDQIPFHIKITRSGVDAQPVFVSDTCTKHLFLPHVTLDLAERLKKGNYIIEAWLDKTKVQEWEERRRLAQETRFLALRAKNEQKVMEGWQKDSGENKIDLCAFIERNGKQSVLSVENNVPVITRRASLTNTKKKRTNHDDKRNNHGGTDFDKTKNSALASSVSMTEPSTLPLDITDEELVVTFNLRLHFSSKVEVKNAAPAKDPLASLHAAWMPSSDHPALDHAATVTMSRASGTKMRQREATLSIEELLKADQGRTSRQRFLENPRNVLLPHQAVGSDNGPASSREAACVGTPRDYTALTRTATDSSREAGYYYAPILSKAQYRNQLLPIRATEIQLPLQQTPPSSSSCALQLRSKSPIDRFICRTGTLSPVMDEDKDVVELRAPFQELLRRQSEDLKQELDKRMEYRESIKNAVRHYWTERRTDTVPSLFLLGSREDESSKRRNRAKNLN